MRVLLALPLALVLGGCLHTRDEPGSVAGGTCAIVSAPEYAVRGKTAYDQRWVDRTTEGIVVGCRQPRPKVRPASFDQDRIVANPPVRKRTLRERFLGS